MRTKIYLQPYLRETGPCRGLQSRRPEGWCGLAACVRTWKTGRRHNSEEGAPSPRTATRQRPLHFFFRLRRLPLAASHPAAAEANPWCRTTHSATAASAFLRIFLQLSVCHALLQDQSCDNVPADLTSKVAHNLVLVSEPIIATSPSLTHRPPTFLLTRTIVIPPAVLRSSFSQSEQIGR